MTTLQTETNHAGACIISLANGHFSMENVTIVSGQNLAANTVLGKITSGGKYAAHDNNASDGTEVAAAILYDKCDASAGDVVAAVIARNAEVNGNVLVYKTTSPAVDTALAAADLLLQKIIVRN